jgi:ribosomal protein L29
MAKEKRRRDWEENHFKIADAYFKYVKEHEKPPSVRELTELTGLSDTGIDNHMNELAGLKFEERFKSFKYLSPRLVSSMFKHGQDGSAPCAKLFFQMVDGLTEKRDLNLKGDALRNMSEDELEKKLNELQISNRDKITFEPKNDDPNEAEAEID